LTQAIIDEELEKLAKSDPGNAEWQRDLARIYARIGRSICGPASATKRGGCFRKDAQSLPFYGSNRPMIQRCQQT